MNRERSGRGVSGGYRRLLAILLALALGTHAAHLPLLAPSPAAEAAARAGSDSAPARAPSAERHHQHTDNEAPTGTEAAAGRSLPGNPAHETLCAEEVASDRTPTSSLAASVPVLGTFGIVVVAASLRVRPAPPPPPRATLARALLQIYRI